MAGRAPVLGSSDAIWALAFVLPYIAVLLAFVLVPLGYGLWMGSGPALYAALWSDPIYTRTLVNTLDFCRAVGQCEDDPGPAAVRFFHAPAAMDQGPACRLHAALGDLGDPGLYLVPLDAGQRAGFHQQLSATGCRGRGSAVAEQPAACPRGEYRRLYLEMAAVLDAGPARGPHGDPAGHLRSGPGGRRWLVSPVCRYYLAADRQCVLSSRRCCR